MDRNSAKTLITNTLCNKFDKTQYRNFIVNFLDGIDENKIFTCGNAYVPEAFREYITSYGRFGKYTDKNNETIEVLWVSLKKDTSLDRARTVQRNFIAWYLNGGRGGQLRKNALVAFYNEDRNDWRFSFVKLDTALIQDDKGKIKIVNNFTPAKRFSFLVGEFEPNHTAQSRLVSLLEKDYPTLDEIEEAFNVEKVSKEFFENYKELFLQLTEDLKNIRENEIDERINAEFTLKSISDADFCKKLLGQLVFLYFIQKKGWLGVARDKKWGEGDKQFLRHTFERAINEGKNFFNDYLEPLFYNALANGERDDNWFGELDCKIPFLNGGLFERYHDYDWVNTDIVFDNTIFSNNKKTKSGDVGTGILDVFDRYNFTVKEDEPLEKEVAVDPEMLGKVFENLLEVQDRKSKGAFYTPREIVHYMCQESLINYLCTELGVNEDNNNISDSTNLTKQDIEDFIHHSDKISQLENIATDKENENSKYKHIFSDSIKNNAKAIDKALEDIKICDPAIGSGAFPVGMLNEIVRARIALVESGFLPEAKKRTNYEYKRQAIQNSIYGVDIESGAVEIAKLRLWLSLVVDEEDIENIKALPNLDYKIVCGNSLLDLYNVIIPVHLQNNFNQYANLLFDESNKQKKKAYQKELNKIKDEVFKIAKSLGCNATFDFNFFFHEVFKQGGFDVVIANPPYVGEKGHKELFEPIKKCSLKEFYLGKMDLFYFFFHLALNILKPNGCCAFITTNYYITALGARKLRADFKHRATLDELINFNEMKIFESALGQHNLITMLTKSNNPDKLCKLVNVNRKGFMDNNFDNIVAGKDSETLYNYISQKDLYEGNENYIRIFKEEENSPLSTILEKVRLNNDILDKYCHIHQGLKTNADKITDAHLGKYSSLKEQQVCKGTGIFVLNKDDKVIKNFNQQEKNYLKPLFKNSDIKKYYTNVIPENYVLYITKKNYISDCHKNIKTHLNKYLDVIKNRAEIEPNGVIPLYAITRPRESYMYETPKIIAPYKSKGNQFAYNTTSWYASGDVYFINLKVNSKLNLKYILALLNSNLYYIWLYNNGKRKGELFELYQKPLSEIPIKKVDEQIQNKFISIVDKILVITQTDDYLQNQEKQEAVKEYEKQIDFMVYKLYDLKYQEVLTIDKNFELSEQEYEEYKL